MKGLFNNWTKTNEVDCLLNSFLIMLFSVSTAFTCVMLLQFIVECTKSQPAKVSEIYDNLADIIFLIKLHLSKAKFY